MRRTDGPFPIWEIIPGQLYQRGKLHDMPLDRKTAGLLYYGITHAVALAPPSPDPDIDLFVRYTHLPIPDGRLRNNGELIRLAIGLAEEMRGGGVVMTMCNAGRNRSGLLSALILREYRGFTGPYAMTEVRKHRPRALDNAAFAAWLEDLP